MRCCRIFTGARTLPPFEEMVGWLFSFESETIEKETMRGTMDLTLPCFEEETMRGTMDLTLPCFEEETMSGTILTGMRSLGSSQRYCVSRSY
jgi:hypothetical protein